MSGAYAVGLAAGGLMTGMLRTTELESTTLIARRWQEDGFSHTAASLIGLNVPLSIMDSQADASFCPGTSTLRTCCIIT